MVKLCKEFEGQLVPECKDAYVGNGQLKKDIEKRMSILVMADLNVKKAPSKHQESYLRKTLSLFYKKIEEEFMERGETSEKQRGILLKLKDARKSHYLKTYRNLNTLFFTKILKKYDKVTNKQILPIFLKEVGRSYLNSPDKVMKLEDEFVETFVKPTQRTESHDVPFFIGLFAICFTGLLIGYGILAHITGVYRPQSDTVYMETVYPVFSIVIPLFLHFAMYGCNIFVWSQTHINYSFIFEISPKDLKYRDVFLICTVAMTFLVGFFFIHLSLKATGYSNPPIQFIPDLLLLIFLLLLICPFNIVYKSSRYHLLGVLRNIVLSPLYKVVMLDFFMADQLCSQVPMLRNLLYLICYYITGSFSTQNYGYCPKNEVYRDLTYVVSFLPYIWRALQCLRMWFDKGETSYLINLGKYVCATLAALANLVYEKERTTGWHLLLVIMSSVATFYQLYWDFVKDWGLFQKDSKNLWLRNDLMFGRKHIYYFSMGINIVLRLVWLKTILHYHLGRIDHRITGFTFAALEVIRRGQWNFYRLENEHLNNVGNFHEVDEEDR